jgi:ParB/RepB/Spo0J family partition protein
MTEIKSSWSFVGISSDARNAAEDASVAAGMELDMWLAQLIKYTSSMELQESGISPSLDHRTINQAILKETAPGGRAAPLRMGGDEEERMFPGVDPMPAPLEEGAAPPAGPSHQIDPGLEPMLMGQDGLPLNVSAKALRPSSLRILGGVSEARIEHAVEAWRRSGSLEPIIVRPIANEPGAYEIVTGLDRWHAARRAHIREVPIEMRELDDEAAIEFALSNQLARPELSPVDEANIYLRLMTEAGRSTEEVSRIAGKPPAHVATMVRILSLPKSVRGLLEAGQINLLHARALLGASNPEAVAREIVRANLDIYQTEQLVRTSNQNAVLLDRAVVDEEPEIEQQMVAARSHAPRPRIVARLAAANRDNQSSNRMADIVAQERSSTGQRAEPSLDIGPSMDAGFGSEPGPDPGPMEPAFDIGPAGGELTEAAIEQRLRDALGLRVSMVDNQGTGIVTLHYASRQELVELLTRLQDRND